MNRITFRKGKRDRFQDKFYEVSHSGKVVARIQELRSGGFFWHTTNGGGINTSSTPASLEACKEQVKEHFKSQPVTKTP